MKSSARHLFQLCNIQEMKIPNKNRAICLIFLADPFKRSPHGILNSVILFLIASAFWRIYPYQRAAFRGTEDLFSAMGNGNGVADQFQWLFLTFDPARPVAGCPSAIHRGLSGSTLRHVRYIIDEPRSLPRINVKDVYTLNILTFPPRTIFPTRCYLRTTNPHTRSAIYHDLIILISKKIIHLVDE